MKTPTLVLASAVFAMMLTEGASQKCVENHECNANEFCYKTGECVACTDCKIYNRQQPYGYPSCPESPKECGPCLAGHRKKDYTSGDTGEVCEEFSKNNEGQNIVYVWVGVLILLVIVICSALFFWMYKYMMKEQNQYASNTNHNQQDEPVEDDTNLHNMSSCGPPPQYDEISHSHGPAVQYEDTSPSAPLLPTSEHENTRRINEQVHLELRYVNEKEHSNFACRATPFQYPDSSYNENSITNNNVDEEDSHEEEVFPSPEDDENTPEGGPASPPPLDDESTMESNWTPGRNYGQETSAAPMPAATSAADVETFAASAAAAAALDTIDEEVSTPAMDESERNEVEEGNMANVSENNPDSGISDNSHQTSTSSLERPFAHFGSASSSSLEEPHGLIRRRSEDDLSTCDTTSKRLRHDTQSLDEGNVSDVFDR